MKRTILAMIMLGSACALFAQNTQTNTTNTNTNTSINNSTSTNNNNWNTTTNSALNNGTSSGTNGTGYYGSYYGNYGAPATTGTTTMNGNTTLSSTGNYSAYGTAASVNVPMNVQTTFQTNYPMAGSNVTWQQVSPEWWRASYGSTGQYTNVMYNQAGQTFNVAVPVLQTYVPQEVVDKAYQMHGINLYDITEMKSSAANNYYAQNNASLYNSSMNGTNGTSSISQTYYLVRYLDNGMLQAEKINADGTAFTDTYMNNQLNSTSTNAAMDNSSMNMSSDSTGTGVHANTTTAPADGKMKVKTKDASGQGSKTKYKNGELKKNKQYKGNGTSTDINNGGF